WKKNWQKSFMDLAEKYPIFIGEVGCQDKPMPWETEKSFESPYTWAPDMLGLIQKYKYNWTAWCFHPRSSPCVLTDWDYNVTPYWGKYVKEALDGKQFEMKKMR
nr:glycoside hydrolase family 5 [Kiritimatiellia bacterium]